MGIDTKGRRRLNKAARGEGRAAAAAQFESSPGEGTERRPRTG